LRIKASVFQSGGNLKRSRAGNIEQITVQEIEALEAKRLDEMRPEEPLWPEKVHEDLHRWSWEKE
jgi:hypothetical protein